MCLLTFQDKQEVKTLHNIMERASQSYLTNTWNICTCMSHVIKQEVYVENALLTFDLSLSGIKEATSPALNNNHWATLTRRVLGLRTVQGRWPDDDEDNLRTSPSPPLTTWHIYSAADDVCDLCFIVFFSFLFLFYMCSLGRQEPVAAIINSKHDKGDISLTLITSTYRLQLQLLNYHCSGKASVMGKPRWLWKRIIN